MKPNKFMQQAGGHIIKVRRCMGLTQEQFAKLMNRTAPRSADMKGTRGLISKHERSDVKIPVDKYLKYISLNPDGNPLD